VVCLSERIFLTFDVEEVRNKEGQLIGESLEYSASGCNDLLSILSDLKIPATFFVTGFFAEQNPKLVKRIKRAGHEISLHGYRHIRLTKLCPSRMRSELEKGVTALYSITKVKPMGFRAPYLAINNSVLDILEDLGFIYDSSLENSISQIFNRARPLDFARRSIDEFHISSFPLLHLPISWHWFRNFGAAYSSLGVRLNLLLNGYAVLFFHSWAFSDAPHKRGIPKRASRKTGKAFSIQLVKFLKQFDNAAFHRLCDFSEGKQ